MRRARDGRWTWQANARRTLLAEEIARQVDEILGVKRESGVPSNQLLKPKRSVPRRAVAVQGFPSCA